MKTQIQFSDIYNSFDGNMQALYTLHVAIEESLGEKEWGMLREYYKEIYSIFGENADPFEVQAILERLIQIDIEDNTLDYKKILEAMNVDPEDVYTFEDGRYVMTKEYKNALLEWAEDNPENANLFFKAFLKTQRPGVFKSELSRQGLLLSAVSQFEFLVLHLLRAYFLYHEKDNELSSDHEIEQLDEIISQRFGKKNIRTISMADKVNFLLQKYPLNGFRREKWDEIVERRNIFTHRSGRADQTYVNKNKSLYGCSNVNIGDRLRISKSYIKESVEYLHLWGLILCQKVWRKSEAEEIKISRGISNTAMQFIRDERYKFGLDFCEKAIDNLQFKSQSDKETLVINYAICADKLGNVYLRDKLLGRIRQTPRQSIPAIKKAHIQVANEPISNRILMAINAIQGNKQRALDFMEKAEETDEITFLDLDYWVIFDYLRDDSRFGEIEKRLEAKVKIA